MVRVLLLIDDYRELVFLQTLLKKTGFDVDGTQNGNKYEDMRLTLNPELIIATSKGSSINGLKIAEDLKKRNGLPNFILVVPHKMAQKVHGLVLKNVDAIIDSPIDAKKLLVTMAKVMELDAEALISKYNKILTSLDTDNEADMQLLRLQSDAEGAVSSRILAPQSPEDEISEEAPVGQGQLGITVSSISDEDRRARMKKSLEELDEPTANGFSTEVVHRWNRRIRTEEKPKDLENLEDERQRFVKSLFKKPSS